MTHHVGKNVLVFKCTFLCSLLTVCYYCFAFISANDRNVFCDRKDIAFLFIIIFFKVRFLKSPLTALIVTGFCCFSSETRLYKKHTDWKKKKKKSRVNAPWMVVI